MVGDASDTVFPITIPADSALTLYTFDRLWADALRRHGMRPAPTKVDISSCRTIEDVIKILEKDEYAMKVFREKGQKIRGFLKPFTSFVQLFLDSSAEIASTAGVPGGNAVFAVFGVLLSATKGVSQSYDALEEILSKLQDFLSRLDVYLADPSVISPALREVLVKILAQLLDVLALCSKRFDEKVHRIRKLIPKRAEYYVQALFGDTEIQDALAKLDKLTGGEQLRLIAETFVAAKNTVKDLRQLNKRQQNFEEDVTAMREELFAIGITQWLSTPDFEDIHRIASKVRQDGTGDWFFGPRFATWTDTKRGIFWIHGNPGSGKSVLFSSIVDRLRSENSLAYFYFNSKQTVRGLITSLVYQLASRSQECFWILRNFYTQHRTSLSPPSDEKLFDCLKALLRASGRVYILIDALDECPEHVRYKELIPLLKNVVKLEMDELRLLVTSRLEADIHKYMTPVITEQFSLHDSGEQAEALACYVTDRVANVEDYPDWSDALRAEVQDVLISRAGGMFAWVDLQLESLRNCPPINVKRALDALPDSLYATYARILGNLKTMNTSLALHVFQCVAFAVYPLFPVELAEVFTLAFEATEASIQPDLRPTDPESQLLKICSSMIHVVTGGSGGEKRLVQFVHFSAHEYLLSAQLPTHLAAYSLDPIEAHITLARLCLEVLNSSLDFSNLPFADYAVRNWMTHVRQTEVQEAMKVSLFKLFNPDLPLFSRWLDAWTSRLDYRLTWSHPFTEHSTPLYVAARLELHSVVRDLLDISGTDVNVAGAPLAFAAASSGNAEVARLVLKHSANPNEHSNNRFTALHVAALKGYRDIVFALLEHGAAIDCCTNDDYTPLHIAAQEGYVEIVRLFLERGAGINVREYAGCTPLHLAAQNGHVDVARELLERGAATSALEQMDGTPLYLAAQHEHIEIIRLLLERGAVVDARQRFGWTPLHVAALSGNVDAVRILLEHGAPVDAREQDGGTPLHVAAQEENVEVARILLDYGAEIEARGTSGWTALHSAAACNANRDMIDLLVERGADIESLTHTGRSALLCAIGKGREATVFALLDHEASITACDSLGFSALDHAVVGGYTSVAHLLLRHGADVRLENGPHGSCISIAERASKVDMTQSTTKTWREGDAKEVAHLLLEAQSETISRGDIVLHRLRRYRSVGSWGDIRTT